MSYSDCNHWTRYSLPGLLGLALLLAGNAAAHDLIEAADSMVTAADRFLRTLTPEQRAKATFEFGDAERLNWHFVPRERQGLPLDEMTPDQRHLAKALLATGLSHGGYLQASTIMALEAVLRDIEKGNGPLRDPARYYVSIFGRPALDQVWGWRVEGHHLAINLTLTGIDGISATPTMFGSNPAEVREGPLTGTRVLAREEDLGRAMVASLTDAQRGIAILEGRAPRDVILGPGREVEILEPRGLAAHAMTSAQRDTLTALVKAFLFRHRPAIAETEFERIEDVGIARIHFAWAGGRQPGEGHYYRVQGPTFIIEYDNTQNQANHIHSTWRDSSNDFGADLLKAHYESAEHR
jgi:hypothetical protein